MPTPKFILVNLREVPPTPRSISVGSWLRVFALANQACPYKQSNFELYAGAIFVFLYWQLMDTNENFGSLGAITTPEAERCPIVVSD